VQSNIDFASVHETIEIAKRNAHLLDEKIWAKRIFPLIDLTDLSENADESGLKKLCEKARQFEVAAICIWPQFVSLAKKILHDTAIKIATVANFPRGTDSLSSVQQQIKQSIDAGADEIDVVFPYSDFLANERNKTKEFVHGCRVTARHQMLKVIVESGVFPDLVLLKSAAFQICEAEIDFLKTSTGKLATGATLEAAYTFLDVIRGGRFSAGIKISGGIRTLDVALNYIELARLMMGEKWIAPKHFRIGASQLVEELSS